MADRNNRLQRRGDLSKGVTAARTRHLCRRKFTLTESPGNRSPRGFTMVEILITITIVATLSAIAVPSYTNYLYKTQVARAITEIRVMERDIWSYQVDTDNPTFELNNDDLPKTLDDIRFGNQRDPWGNLYEYNPYDSAQKGIEGKMRKCRFLKPLNTDYDIYSVGKDGKSDPKIDKPESYDDVIRASNGAFVGLASEF
ncbi:MAG: prepilin-type N-terminal cleavage/methylation domain-containing protein [bacterium]